MKKFWVLPLLTSILLIGCQTAQVQPQKSQLEIREFQTRNYETNNVKMVMKAMLNVLQDDQFIVKNVDLELGFLTASKEVDTTDTTAATLNALSVVLGGSGDATYEKNRIIEVTANITEFGETCRVRVNFQSKTLNNKGGVMSVSQIDDASYYQDFFFKVDKGIFIQKEGI
jgi:hypothetical protein